ncbi:MAG TPA: GAF and ANTAR domain-containing protein [Micromonosporaceae bacterium]|nr:GAF and ANTAR domain-containing protein [Micromonosporaceae bacterium]
MTQNNPPDATSVFAELGRIKLGETDLPGILGRVAELAKRSLPGASEVSVTLIRSKGPQTAASTGDIAVALDEWQYERGVGPCLVASRETATVWVPDMAAEPRWPDWAARALDTGVHSSLSIGLPIDESVAGALNVYATAPRAFDDDGILLAQTFAGYAAVALANAHVLDAAATLAQHMQAAMERRAVIEQAKGIIMGERRCTADEAFGVLTKMSQDTNRKLRDVAAAFVARAQESRRS